MELSLDLPPAKAESHRVMGKKNRNMQTVAKNATANNKQNETLIEKIKTAVEEERSSLKELSKKEQAFVSGAGFAFVMRVRN